MPISGPRLVLLLAVLVMACDQIAPFHTRPLPGDAAFDASDGDSDADSDDDLDLGRPDSDRDGAVDADTDRLGDADRDVDRDLDADREDDADLDEDQYPDSSPDADPDCAPSCDGRQCGSDGCDGTCPPGCDVGWRCNGAGRCVCDHFACASGSCERGPHACCRPPRSVTVDLMTPEGRVCDEDRVLDLDGEVTGLGMARDDDVIIEIDGSTIAACVLVDFRSVIDATEIRVHARAANGPVCGCSCGEGMCDTGWTMGVFASVDGETHTHCGRRDLSGRHEAHTNVAPAPFRYVLLCRSHWGAARDHIEIDYVEACSPAP